MLTPVRIYQEDAALQDDNNITSMGSVPYNSEVEQFKAEEYPMLKGDQAIPRLSFQQ